jgi:hypothetical protein
MKHTVMRSKITKFETGESINGIMPQGKPSIRDWGSGLLFEDVAGCQHDMCADKYIHSLISDPYPTEAAFRVKAAIQQTDIEDMRKYVFFLIVIALPVACKSLPPENVPVSTLEFERIEGSGIHRVVLYYRFKTENHRSAPMTLKIPGWNLTMNGHEIDRQHAILKSGGDIISGGMAAVAPRKTFETELELHIDLSVYSDADTNPLEDDGDTFMPVLTLATSCRYGAEPPLTGIVPAVAEFPRIREPEFSITSIAIMQAELINTRFAVTIKIDNPNPFPVTLSAFKYELYGQGMLWADGRQRDILAIPAKDAAETKLLLVMNFINMKRGLLDEIIAMRQVGYWFTGDSDVETGISWLPQFSMKFDRQGYSKVLQ